MIDREMVMSGYEVSDQKGLRIERVLGEEGTFLKSSFLSQPILPYLSIKAVFIVRVIIIRKVL